MASGATAQRRMTLDEFFAWDSGDDLRYELIDGVVVAMTSPRNAHGKISIKLGRRIDEALDARPSCSAESEVGIVSPTRRSTFYQADLAVSCTPQVDEGHEMIDPLLIVEILSPSTEDKDRKVKLVDYRQIPSVREVLLVDCTRPYCELHRRTEEDQWLVQLVVDLKASITLESIGAELTLADIYANVSFNAPDAG